MKTASEVAEEIYWKVSKSTNELDWQQLFAQALTAYAEERVKEAREELYWLKRKEEKREENHDEDCHCNDYKELARKARAEALEEAAKVADDWEHTGMKISSKIRALKDKP